jgi:hypothetical protein
MTKETKLSANDPQPQRDREKTKPIQRHPRIDPPLQPGQPVYHPDRGFCEVMAIEGEDITISAGQTKLVVERDAFVTLVQAQINWHSDWLNGEKRRLREGEELFIVKGLSRFGEWQTFLDRNEIPRSTADDLIRRYLIELARKGRVLNLHGYRASSDDGTDRQDNQHIRDSDDTERRELVAKEVEKRQGRQPSHHRYFWSLRIGLPTRIIALCRDRYRLEQKNSRKYWQDKAYEFARQDRPSSSEEEAGGNSEDE